MSFEVFDTVFACAVGLVFQLAFDLHSPRSHQVVVRINIVNVNVKAGARSRQRARCLHMMFGSDTMQPNRKVACANLGMNGITFAVALYTARRKPKYLNQKVVRRRDVVVHQDGSESLNYRHVESPIGKVSVSRPRRSARRPLLQLSSALRALAFVADELALEDFEGARSVAPRRVFEDRTQCGERSTVLRLRSDLIAGAQFRPADLVNI
jgi:hypothetical protein